ncbi:hypothetical protein [Actinoplanes derwentensis]|uniref:hypothetical protein n=1 Tax=Actinoplanes derwentensis TaxID=113562 RepID=UPI0012FDFB50|nr:hypothetical protein [Actinoplanes derwentensis]
MTTALHRLLNDATEFPDDAAEQEFIPALNSENVVLGVLLDISHEVLMLTFRADTRILPRFEVAHVLASLDLLLVAALERERLERTDVVRLIGNGDRR